MIFPEKSKLNQETTSPMLTSCYRNPIMMLTSKFQYYNRAQVNEAALPSPKP
jgi:hypothetical protein